MEQVLWSVSLLQSTNVIHKRWKRQSAKRFIERLMHSQNCWEPISILCVTLILRYYYALQPAVIWILPIIAKKLTGLYVCGVAASTLSRGYTSELLSAKSNHGDSHSDWTGYSTKKQMSALRKSFPIIYIPYYNNILNICSVLRCYESLFSAY